MSFSSLYINITKHMYIGHWTVADVSSSCFRYCTCLP